MSQKQTQGLGGLSYKSTNDLSGSAADVTNGNPIGTTYKNGKGLAVIADTANDCSIVIAGANARVLGVLADTPKAAQAAKVESVRGTSVKVLTGAAVTRGDNLQTDANGRAITGAGAAQKVFAIAMESASAANRLIEAVLVDVYVA